MKELFRQVEIDNNEIKKGGFVMKLRIIGVLLAFCLLLPAVSQAQAFKDSENDPLSYSNAPRASKRRPTSSSREYP